MIGDLLSGFIGVIIGSIVGSLISVKGALCAVNKQFEHEKSLIQDEKARQEIVIEASIILFLKDEISYNLNKVIQYESFKEHFLIGNPESCGYKIEDLRFEEFNRIKHDIIKYSAPIISDTLKVYKWFMTLHDEGSFKAIGREKMQDMINTFDNYNKHFK